MHDGKLLPRLLFGDESCDTPHHSPRVCSSWPRMESLSPGSLYMPRLWSSISRCSLVILLLQRVTAVCYFPDRTILHDDRPCIVNGTEDSFCCGPQATCMSDKLCWDGGSGYVRGSCTDVLWKSPACPQFCLGMFGEVSNLIGIWLLTKARSPRWRRRHDRL